MITVIRKLFFTQLWIIVGIFIGQFPIGDDTLGHFVAMRTRKAWGERGVTWQTTGSVAGWLEKLAPLKSKPSRKPADSDAEGLSSVDKEALRQLLE